MKIKNLFLLSVMALSASSVYAWVADGQVKVYDKDLRSKIMMPTAEEPMADVYFLEFPKQKLEIEAYQFPNFEGQASIFSDNDIPYKFSEIKSFKVLSSYAEETTRPGSVYILLQGTPEQCLAVSYQSRSQGIPRTQLGSFCGNWEPQELFNFVQQPPNVQNAEDLRFYLINYDTNFSVAFGAIYDSNSAIIPESSLSTASWSNIQLLDKNLLSIRNYD